MRFFHPASWLYNYSVHTKDTELYRIVQVDEEVIWCTRDLNFELYMRTNYIMAKLSSHDDEIVFVRNLVIVVHDVSCFVHRNETKIWCKLSGFVLLVLFSIVHCLNNYEYKPTHFWFDWIFTGSISNKYISLKKLEIS